MARRISRRRRYYRPNVRSAPMQLSTTDTVVLGGVMIGIIAVVGFAFFSAKNASAATQTPAAPPQLPPAPSPPVPGGPDWSTGVPVPGGTTNGS
jgi:hypothetical protein